MFRIQYLHEKKNGINQISFNPELEFPRKTEKLSLNVHEDAANKSVITKGLIR